MRINKRHINQADGAPGWSRDDSDASGPRGRGGRRRNRQGKGRGRARRGDARLIVLDALRDSPKHGYEIIKSLEERSAGQYTPSPGTVYPTLQYLADQGLVRAQEEGERRVYQLTEAGQTELAAQEEQVAAFWARVTDQGADSAARHEVRFLQDELDHLNRIVWRELRPAIAGGRQETVRQVRNAIEACQDQIRQISAGEQSE
ncbi:MAG: helix-turn-helix transcriptional regulator [Caldilineaceae bacterium]|nr:helix-turn-helix transcriptional regulator [Caldilineaceae bacterium]